MEAPALTCRDAGSISKALPEILLLSFYWLTLFFPLFFLLNKAHNLNISRNVSNKLYSVHPATQQSSECHPPSGLLFIKPPVAPHLLVTILLIPGSCLLPVFLVVVSLLYAFAGVLRIFWMLALAVSSISCIFSQNVAFFLPFLC